MSVFPVYKLKAKFDGINWTYFTVDVVKDDIEGFYGIFDNTALARIADPGELKFSLNNTATNSGGVIGYYTPGHPSCRAGFQTGLEVGIDFIDEGTVIEKWTGLIPPDGIDLETGKLGAPLVHVTVRDWFEQALMHELESPEFAQNQSIMYGVAAILAEMNLQPKSVSYKTATFVFNTLFDTVSATTTAYVELLKLVISELGYIYLTRNGLVVEGLYTRTTEKKTLSKIPKAISESGFLLKSDGGHLLKSDGGKIILHEAEDATFDNSQSKMTTSPGKNLANRIKMTAFPRKVDGTATTVLYSLASPIYLDAGATVVLTGAYKDPTGIYSDVSGIDMVTPLAPTTHYLMNSSEDGSGTDLTANLTALASFYTGKPIFTLTNNGTGGWITKLEAVGKGVYIPEPITLTVQDDASVLANRPIPLEFNMKYQNDPIVLSQIAPVILGQLKDPRLDVQEIEYVANRSAKLLRAFLYLEPGDRFHHKEDVSGVDSDFFIQGVKFKIKPGGKLTYSFFVKDAGLDVFNFAIWDVSAWDDGTVWGF
jgi:hypothetical protein